MTAISVKNIISLFENHNNNNNIISSANRSSIIKRTKSTGSLQLLTNTTKSLINNNDYHQNHQDNKTTKSLDIIEQELTALESEINVKYKIYGKTEHIYYQNALLALLTDLVVDHDDPSTIAQQQHRSDLVATIKQLNIILNQRLPTELRNASGNQPSTSTSSVRHLKQLFEHNDKGLNLLKSTTIVNNHNAPTTYLSFDTTVCHCFRANSTNDIRRQCNGDYIVDRNFVRNQRLVPNTAIYRRRRRSLNGDLFTVLGKFGIPVATNESEDNHV